MATRSSDENPIAPENGGEEVEPSDDKLFDHDYLKTCIKRLRKKPMQFGFGLANRPEDCVLVLKPKGQAKQLSTLIRREKSLRKVTFGVACADKNDPATLVFELEGKQLPGLAKKGRKFLRAQKLLPFRDLKLVVGGRVVEDIQETGGQEPSGQVGGSRRPT
jgi:hypothetical protein